MRISRASEACVAIARAHGVYRSQSQLTRARDGLSACHADHCARRFTGVCACSGGCGLCFRVLWLRVALGKLRRLGAARTGHLRPGLPMPGHGHEEDGRRQGAKPPRRHPRTTCPLRRATDRTYQGSKQKNVRARPLSALVFAPSVRFVLVLASRGRAARRRSRSHSHAGAGTLGLGGSSFGARPGRARRRRRRRAAPRWPAVTRAPSRMHRR